MHNTINGAATNGRHAELKLVEHADGLPGAEHASEAGANAGARAGASTGAMGGARADRATQSEISVREDTEIAEMLTRFIGWRTFRQVSRDTGYHAESVRRYLNGSTKIPCKFVASVCAAYQIDPAVILFEGASGAFRRDPSPREEDRLAESLRVALEPGLKDWIRNAIGNDAPSHE